MVQGSWLLLVGDAARARRVRSRLDALRDVPAGTVDPSTVVKPTPRMTRAQAEGMLSTLFGLSRLERLLSKSGMAQRPSTIVGWCAAAAMTGFALGTALRLPAFLALLFGVVAAAGPVGYVGSRVLARQKRFTGQMPEAVDLLVRSLKAGHSLASGFKAVGEELGEPIGPEFAAAHEAMSLGRELEKVMEDLRLRVDTPEVRLLCTSVLVQRETGGNLVEILEKIAEMIRRRLTFSDKLAALTAEGRLSGLILVGLPPLMVIVLFVVNRPYARELLAPGRLRGLLVGAVILQAIGAVWIRRIVSVRY